MMSDTFVCGCGCNIEFIKFSMGCDIYFFHNGAQVNKIFSESQMVNDSWCNYINVDEFSNWGEMWNYICNNMNNADNNVMRHLYNVYKDVEIPADARMELEYIF